MLRFQCSGKWQTANLPEIRLDTDIRIYKLSYRSVLPRGRYFGRKAQKGTEKKLAGPGKSGTNFCLICQKRAELFSSLVFHKIIYISCSKDYIYL
jgi:hypothetical protein